MRVDIFCKTIIFSLLTIVLTAFYGYSQVVGGGSLEKPVAAKLGGLIDSNVFSKLKIRPLSESQKQSQRSQKQLQNLL